jgi:ATP-dependent Clp endopeptidase proteolytic subunit ClpP
MNWYTITNKADKSEIWIYEEIGEDFWTGGGITAKNFQKELSAITSKQIDLHINSPGGAVFDGVTIYNLLRQHPANITTYIDGIAASIASVIALAGNKVIMAENALYMMHNPSGLVMGNSEDMRKMAEVLDKIRGTMTGVYMGKSGKEEQEINAMLDAETWMTADEAMEAGLIDEIGVEMDMAACARFIPIMAKAGFKHVPDSIRENKKDPNERDLEKALRDAGCSRSQAKEILAKGFVVPIVRDAQPDPATPLREAEPVKKESKDKVYYLLTQAEIMAPSAFAN